MALKPVQAICLSHQMLGFFWLIHSLLPYMLLFDFYVWFQPLLNLTIHLYPHQQEVWHILHVLGTSPHRFYILHNFPDVLAMVHHWLPHILHEDNLNSSYNSFYMMICGDCHINTNSIQAYHCSVCKFPIFSLQWMTLVYPLINILDLFLFQIP